MRGWEEEVKEKFLASRKHEEYGISIISYCVVSGLCNSTSLIHITIICGGIMSIIVIIIIMVKGNILESRNG